MIYRTMPYSDHRLSILGYGCMRFPRKGATVDFARTEKQLLSALDQGLNFLDTAYIYGNSEAILGKILAKNQRRGDVYLATKLPAFLIRENSGLQATLNTQLERLKTDYIDYYLMHNLTSFADWQRLKNLGVLEFIEREKAQGRLHKIGFSFHGNLQAFKELVADYPWDFCMIQYNYLDEHYQAGREGLLYAAAKGLGIIVMEPLRGGTLGAKMPPSIKSVFTTSGGTSFNPAELALRWLWQQPQIQVVLSGMNEEEHIANNIRLAASVSEQTELTPAEEAALRKAKQLWQEKIKAPCTACAYCLPCPYNVDIPTCLAYYNDYSAQKSIAAKAHYFLATEGAINGQPTKASLCQICGICEKNCPQEINISHHLHNTAAIMEKGLQRPVLKLACKFMQRKNKPNN